MKKIIIGFIVGLLIGIAGTPLMSVTRDNLYHKFGAVLIEAVVLVMTDEINALRSELSMSSKTEQQMLDAIETKQSQLETYDWMD